MPREDIKRWQVGPWSVFQDPNDPNLFQVTVPAKDDILLDTYVRSGLVPAPMLFSKKDLESLNSVLTEFINDSTS